jgi:hypothetical protein
MLSIYQNGGTVKAAHQRGLSPENILSGLWKSGIFPFPHYNRLVGAKGCCFNESPVYNK